MRRLLVSFIVFVLSVTPLIAKEVKLSRGEALELITEHEEFQRRYRHIYFHQDGYDRALREGMFQPNGSWELTPSREYVGVIEGGRPGGKLIFLTSEVTGDVKIETTITGIRQFEDNSAVAEFTWEYTALPEDVRDYTRQGKSGKAVFQLYDDGWRISKVTMAISSQPFPPSQRELDRQASVGDKRRDAIVELLTSMRRDLANGGRTYDYGLEATLSETMVGSAKLYFVVQSFDPETGVIEAWSYQYKRKGLGNPNLIFPRDQLGLFTGKMDMTTFELTLRYSPARMNKSNGKVESQGRLIPHTLRLKPHFDDNGKLDSWQMPLEIKSKVGMFWITTKKAKLG